MESCIFACNIYKMRFESFKSHILSLLEARLPKELSYHGVHHTIYVLDAATRIAAHEGISEQEKEWLYTAVLLHDIGFIETYHNHEEKGIEIATPIMLNFGFLPFEIQLVNNLIRRTRIPQSATNLLEKIICDADLDYLGTDDFFPIGNMLFDEFLQYGIVKDEKEWNRLQVSFLSGHSYYTDFAIKFRKPKKEENLQLVKDIVNTYKD